MNAFTKINLTRPTFDMLSVSHPVFISEQVHLFNIVNSSHLLNEQVEFFLYYDKEDLLLKFFYNKEKGSLYFDLKKELSSHRQKNYSLKEEPLAKSLAIKKSDSNKMIWDATAGTGKDLMLIKHFVLGTNTKMIAFERNPLIYLLLFNGLFHAGITEVKLIYADSLDVFAKKAEVAKPDIIYYDPMYPEKKKSALPRKEMQIFKELIGPDLDTQNFLQHFRAIAKDRVVVKRSLMAEMIAPDATASYKGKSTRYDMYKCF
jgi:16S rRNA (guanine1516-N2)-methyltransferase